jgi:lipopolysaccharide biosynthesis glycosyltransferase
VETTNRRALPGCTDAVIVIAADERYIDALPAFVSSLALHNPELAVPIACLVPADRHEYVLQRVQAVFAGAGMEPEMHVVGYPTAGLRTRGYVTVTGYFRLLIPDILRAKRALYLDIDTLILSDLQPLLSIDLKGAPLGAVRDILNPYLGSPLALRGDVLPPELAMRPYFNAGVLLMDLDLWRSEAIGRSAMSLIERNDARLRFMDQDALNLIVSGNFTELDPAWNMYPTPSTVVDLKSAGLTVLADSIIGGQPASDDVSIGADVKIAHFIGSPKPWTSSYPTSSAGATYRWYQERLWSA